MSLYNGIKIDTISSTLIYLSQRREINDLLDRFAMIDCNPARTPMEVNFANEVHAANIDPTEEQPVFEFPSLIGSLLWIARMTRPDIIFPVINLSAYTKQFKSFHVTAAKRILRYLKGTINFALRFTRSDDLASSSELVLHALSDADWGGDIATRKSTSGAVTKIFGSYIVGTCKKQEVVALSTTEAELIALTEAAKDVKSIYNILFEMHTVNDCPFTWPKNISIYVDNIAAQFIATNRVHNSRTRHIDIRYMFIRDLIEKLNVSVQRVESSENTSDIFTKALPYVTHILHRENLGVMLMPT